MENIHIYSFITECDNYHIKSVDAIKKMEKQIQHLKRINELNLNIKRECLLFKETTLQNDDKKNTITYENKTPPRMQNSSTLSITHNKSVNENSKDEKKISNERTCVISRKTNEGISIQEVIPQTPPTPDTPDMFTQHQLSIQLSPTLIVNDKNDDKEDILELLLQNNDDKTDKIDTKMKTRKRKL